MPIASPQAIKFSNEKIRVLATRKAEIYLLEKQVLAEWFAQGLDIQITNTADIIVDGAEIDGRSIITGAMATNVITRISEDITDLEASAGAKLNTLLAVAVLGS